MAQLIPDQVNLASQFYVKEGGTEPTENPMVMSIMDNTNASDVTEGQEDGDGHGQVVAQVVQAEEPTPGNYASAVRRNVKARIVYARIHSICLNINVL